jgi:hypothetical protein
MTRENGLFEPWNATRDAAHPVRWSPADGDTPAYLTLKGAAERLAGYGIAADVARSTLLAGQQLRTPFAFYQIDTPIDTPPDVPPGLTDPPPKGERD